MGMKIRHFAWLLLVSCAEQATTATDIETASAPVRLDVSEAAGVSREVVRAMFAPVREKVRRCAAADAGKITIRVARREGVLHFDLAPVLFRYSTGGRQPAWRS